MLDAPNSKDYEFVRPDGVVSVPDNNIKNYYIHDLEYILKDVEISDRDKFYDIVNNSYLYNDSELNDYFANIDDYILQKMKFFMDVLKQNCSNKQEMIKTVNVLKKRRKRTKKKPCPKGTKRKVKYCMKPVDKNTKKKRCPNGSKRKEKNCVKNLKKK